MSRDTGELVLPFEIFPGGPDSFQGSVFNEGLGGLADQGLTPVGVAPGADGCHGTAHTMAHDNETRDMQMLTHQWEKEGRFVPMEIGRPSAAIGVGTPEAQPIVCDHPPAGRFGEVFRKAPPQLHGP
jgi:hypothetical protein